MMRRYRTASSFPSTHGTPFTHRYVAAEATFADVSGLSASRVNLIHFYHTLWFQFFYYRHVLGRAWAADSWLNALKVLLMGPGWQPGKPRLGVITDIPDVSIDVTLIGTWRDFDCSVLH